jgi:hypothetical protein
VVYGYFEGTVAAANRKKAGGGKFGEGGGFEDVSLCMALVITQRIMKGS